MVAARAVEEDLGRFVERLLAGGLDVAERPTVVLAKAKLCAWEQTFLPSGNTRDDLSDARKISAYEVC